MILERRTLLIGMTLSGIGLLSAVASCAPKSRIYAMQIHLDPGCGCCHTWVDLMQQAGRFNVTATEAKNMLALKAKLGVPSDLSSCHTAEVGDYVIEGHVPVADVLRLIEERPAGVRGIAVPGMPRGSPGMEQPNGTIDPYEVVAFTAEGKTSTFARYGV
jgi:hypothetical protein